MPNTTSVLAPTWRACASIIGTADLTPGTLRATSTVSSPNPPSAPRIVNVALPVIEPTLVRKNASVDWLIALIATNSATPIATPTIVSVVRTGRCQT